MKTRRIIDKTSVTINIALAFLLPIDLPSLRYLAIRRDTSSYVELVEIDDHRASRAYRTVSINSQLVERSGGERRWLDSAYSKEYSIGFLAIPRSICPDFLRRFGAICTIIVALIQLIRYDVILCQYTANKLRTRPF